MSRQISNETYHCWMVLQFATVSPSRVQFGGVKREDVLSARELSNDSAVMKPGTLGHSFICLKLKLEITYTLCSQSIGFTNEASQKKNKA